MSPNELLNSARDHEGLTDAELARRLGIGRATVSNWRSGHQAITDRHIVALANIAHLDPATVLAEMQAGKATPEVAKVWKEVARRTALTALLLTVTTVDPLVSGRAYASNGLHNFYIMYISACRFSPRSVTALKLTISEVSHRR